MIHTSKVLQYSRRHLRPYNLFNKEIQHLDQTAKYMFGSCHICKVILGVAMLCLVLGESVDIIPGEKV